MTRLIWVHLSNRPQQHFLSDAMVVTRFCKPSLSLGGKKGQALRDETRERKKGCKRHHGNLSQEPCGSESRLVEPGQQPEASLASGANRVRGHESGKGTGYISPLIRCEMYPVPLSMPMSFRKSGELSAPPRRLVSARTVVAALPL